jgi:DNA-binding NtrC family response regulator
MTEIESNIKVLIVDDELEYREVIQMILEDEGYITDTAESAEHALIKLEKEVYHIVLTDLKMNHMDGLDLLRIIKESYKNTEVILITGNGTIENAVDAMKIGAYNYIVKTQPSEKLIMEMDKVKAEIIRKQLEKKPSAPTFSYLVDTKSQAFRKVLDTVEKAALSDANILILGESGVGKEMIASYIHECSRRKEGTFIPVNCSSISETLLESELFGHEKGAFTGALESRSGMFKAADGGTLFLDEIGDISLSTQVKLLRALETRQIQRIGSTDLETVDFRLICATNRDLKQGIAEGYFREDFYYRINTIVVEVPALRDRREDIGMFIDYFVDLFSKKMFKEILSIDKEVMDFLLNYEYKGNIREMKNIIERLVVLAEAGTISRTCLPSVERRQALEHAENQVDVTQPALLTKDQIKPLKEVRQELEADYIEQALKACKYNVSEAARQLGLSRRQLYNKMDQYKI